MAAGCSNATDASVALPTRSAPPVTRFGTQNCRSAQHLPAFIDWVRQQAEDREDVELIVSGAPVRWPTRPEIEQS